MPKLHPIILETAVGSQKSAQALDAPGKIKKCLITTEVTSTFCLSPCTPISYAAFLRPTAISRLNRVLKDLFGFPTTSNLPSEFTEAVSRLAHHLINRKL